MLKHWSDSLSSDSKFLIKILYGIQIAEVFEMSSFAYLQEKIKIKKILQLFNYLRFLSFYQGEFIFTNYDFMFLSVLLIFFLVMVYDKVTLFFQFKVARSQKLNCNGTIIGRNRSLI